MFSHHCEIAHALYVMPIPVSFMLTVSPTPVGPLPACGMGSLILISS